MLEGGVCLERSVEMYVNKHRQPECLAAANCTQFLHLYNLTMAYCANIEEPECLAAAPLTVHYFHIYKISQWHTAPI